MTETTDGLKQSRDSGRLQIRNASKSFGPVQALKSVSFDILPGEIHALCGGNGSGKSTLIKGLAGIQPLDEGTIVLEGVEVAAHAFTPELSAASGVRVVHQDLGLFHDMSVAENIALGGRFQLNKIRGIDRKRLLRFAAELLEEYEIDADPRDELASLSRVAQTQVAIARVLGKTLTSAKGLLILDEPTASLPIHEVSMLMQNLKNYASKGQSILYVSHRLDEILEWTDSVSVLRDGQYTGNYVSRDLTEAQLAELIVGRSIASIHLKNTDATRESVEIASLNNVSSGHLSDLNLSVKAGEILGLAGLQGSGRTEILELFFGTRQPDEGAIVVQGEKRRFKNAKQAMDAGVAFVPEDRVYGAVFIDSTIEDNLTISVIEKYWRRGFFQAKRMRRDASKLIERFRVKIGQLTDEMFSLSGGNQQKVILGRWLRRDPQLILLDEPTQGVDVGARSEIYTHIREYANQGAGVVVVASDLEELSLVSDRVLVIRQGRITNEVVGDAITAHHLTELIYGKVSVS